ncbi:uncharacterized protein LOC129770532 [Toxorhynchites rutilus septentrionalis]|uniref:uncharacterized protein LOC129770532 n=1 Tax=Toxorhynchites rutilus septentrionalis TaxID=329112 RepID=UPI00247AF8A8|nr:uncharacterized protein LOC129770532 [Toxorhynchites rutilus septentrionalis]
MATIFNSTSGWLKWTSEHGFLWDVLGRHNNFSYHIGPTKMPNEYNQAAAGNELISVGTMFSSAQSGFLTGVLIILFLRYHLTRVKEELSAIKMFNFVKCLKIGDIRKFLFILGTFLEFVLLSPVFFLVYVSFRCYRSGVAFTLKRRYGSHFKGLLDGTDVVWAIEGDNSRGMINIMAYIEEPDENLNNNTSAELLLVLRKRISSRLMRSQQPHPKMFWKRNLELGYYYWSDLSDLTIEDYIRYLEYIPLEEHERYIDEPKLRGLISAICNRRLAGNHTSSWEILVGRQPQLDKERNVLRFPILFRVHHSLGDGVALLRLLLEGIADKETPYRWKLLSNFKVMNIDYILKEQSNFAVEGQSFIAKLLRKIPSSRELEMWKRGKLRLLWSIFTAPAFFHEVSAREVDVNCIHTSESSSQKVVSWIHEEEFSGTHWVDIIKRTKQQVPGARFSDALLTALSSSLQKYFHQRTQRVPNDITVVLPTRIERESPQLRLHNRFSVALQTLPIASGIELNDPNRMHNLVAHLTDVKQFSDLLRCSPDYLINYWILSTVACLFPDTILRKILTSAHSTLAISNLPGPQQKPRIHGHELKNISFWIPNIGQTAVGLTLLTYGGKLQLGILADKAVIQSEDDAHSILAEMVNEIERMGKVLEVV